MESCRNFRSLPALTAAFSFTVSATISLAAFSFSLPPAQAAAEAGNIAATPLKETPSCAAGAAAVKFLEVRPANFNRLLTGEPLKVTLVEEQGCIRVGDTLGLFSIIRALPSRAIIYREAGPDTRVTAIEGVDFDKLSEKSRAFFMKKLENGVTLKSKTVIYPTLQKISPAPWKRPEGAPAEHPLAKPWAATGAMPSASAFTILDVRGEAEFKAKNIPGSIRVEVGPAEAAQKVLRPNELTFDRKITIPAGRPVLVLGPHAQDFRAYNLVSALAVETKHTLLYSREGWAGLEKAPPKPPAAK